MTHPGAPSGGEVARVIVLGTDALLAALPATPVQVVHACLAAGYDAAVPASWGDELVASACVRELATRDAGPVIQCSCPCVARRLTQAGPELEKFMLALDSPPVAAARYVRELYGDEPVSVTYAGACPSGDHPMINSVLDPQLFLDMLAGRGVSLGDQPVVFDSILPPDRRRHRSLPGGVPSPDSLDREAAGRRLVEISDELFAAELAEQLLRGESVLLDVAPRLGCVCSGSVVNISPGRARSVVQSMEPPRSPAPVVDPSPRITLRASVRDLAAAMSTLEDCGLNESRQSGWQDGADSAQEHDLPPRPERAGGGVERGRRHRRDKGTVAPAPRTSTYGARDVVPQTSARADRPATGAGRARGLPRTFALARATSGRHRAVPDTSLAGDAAAPDVPDAAPGTATAPAPGAVGVATPPSRYTPGYGAPAQEAEAESQPSPAEPVSPLSPAELTEPAVAQGGGEGTQLEDNGTPSHGVPPEEFNAFLDDVRAAVAESVADWRSRLREAIVHWSERGYVTTVLERAAQLPRSPDVDALLQTFARATSHLYRLEHRALALAPELEERLAGHPAFRDPERVADAELIVERLARRRPTPWGPGAAVSGGEREHGPHEPPHPVPAVIYEWQALEELVIEELDDTPGFTPGRLS